MNWQMIKGYLAAIFSGGLLIAAAVLVFFQWANVSEFSLYGYGYDIMSEGNRYAGGVNTALLVMCSAVAGIAALYLVRLLLYGLGNIRGGRKRQSDQQTAHRLAEWDQTNRHNDTASNSSPPTGS